MIEKDFAGRVVLVTGGAKGVGKAVARRFAERGAHVILNFFHSLGESKETRAELEALGAKVDVIRASVAMKPQVDRMFDEIASRFGRLDVLVNNAASGALLGIDEIEEVHFSRALDTNLKGAFWCSRRAVALMPPEGGAIVNISSIGASLVPANYLVVGTSKAALEALTRYLAAEYAGRGVRVNTASATLIEGDVANLFPEPESTKRSYVQGTPMRRLATADDMAELVVYLASNQARFVTGQVLLADGGLSLCHEALSPRPLGAAAVPVPAAPAPVVAATGPQGAPSAEAEGDDSDDIAVVGMGIAVPGASDTEAYWQALMNGPELFSNVPADRWDFRSFVSDDPNADDKSYQSRSVYMQDFKPLPRLAAEIDAGAAPTELTTLWLRHALMQALDGVKGAPGGRSSFLVGYTADGSQHLEESMVLAGARARLEAALDQAEASPEERARCLAEIGEILGRRYWRGAEGLAGFFPHRVGAEAMRGVLPDGTDYIMVDTACSSSLYSIDLGMKDLLSGRKDLVACGGSFALAPRGSVLFAKLHGLSKSGEVRPLDKANDGVLFADGAGVVVLKRLSRALADGDRVMAVLKAFGSSSDGKGKAIYAPSSKGQCIAIERAYSHPAIEPAQVDWVVAHATGTPAGDLAEFQSLRQMFRADRDVMVTSNKSLIGHTGWAAGVVSVIQVVLGLQKQTIPPQHRYDASPADFKLDECRLRVPKQALAWPAKPGVARTAAVSGFGFGGTNGHLIVQEYQQGFARGPRRARKDGEPIVVVAWAAKFPGLADAAAITEWLQGRRAGPEASFGEHYPIPSFEQVRMPPALLRAIDRCQLMALDAAAGIRAQLPEFWRGHAKSIGVVMGHMGPTRNAALFSTRCYLDDIATALSDDPRTSGSALAQEALQRLRAEMDRLIAPPTENSFPGMMPNVIPSRIANYFDLNGLNMTVDTGHDSALAAFDVASRYLRAGEIDMAIVGGINGNVADEILPALGERRPAEGIVMFAVMTESMAREAGLKVLAPVDRLTAGGRHEAPAHGLRDAQGRSLTYLGGDAAVEALRRLCGGTPPEGGRLTSAPAATGTPAAATASLPAVLRRAAVRADGRTVEVTRHEVEWREAGDLGRRPGVPFLTEAAVLVTDDPARIERLGTLPADLIVLSTVPIAEPRAGWFHFPEVSEAAVDALLSPVAGRLRHVRLLLSLGAADRAPEAGAGWLALHDLCFLALKHAYDRLGDGGSFLMGLADAVPAGAPHPVSGLFTGLLKALAMELPGSRVVGVVSDSADPAVVVRQVEQEAASVQFLPVILRLGERRLTARFAATAGELPADGHAGIGRPSVIVAVGGARGITAELMKAVAQQFRPTLYLIGSNDLDAQPADLLEGSDEDFARRRAQYIREQRALDPGLPLPRINKAFDRLVDARTARRNLEAMKAACGADRVHYLRADVLDPRSLNAAVGRILQREPRIDLVVNAAGLNRSAIVPAKSLAEFRTVRDIKVHGYWNLRAAFGARRPRMWCNFGSLIGHTGQSGETDYSAANDFLNTSSLYHRSLGEDEFTIGWTLWASVGLGANPVTQAFLDKAGMLTAMSTEDGVHLFLREINLARRPNESVHLGEREKRAVLNVLPGYFDADEAPSAAAAPGFYLDRRSGPAAEGDAWFERVFDLDTDAYLQHHLVNGYATLPGTFVTEIAAEAALHLHPQEKVVGFEDAVFHHFLRVYDRRRPSLKRIHARTLVGDGGRRTVQVRVMGDVVGPGGQVLVPNKLHFEIKVVLAPAYAPAPVWQAWPERPFTPIADPYHVAAAPVRLTSMFVTTQDTGATPQGKRARYDLRIDTADPVFRRFVMPALLLDGLARVSVLNHVAEHYVPLAAPAAIRRIDLYEPGNDIALAARHPRLDLYATPLSFTLDEQRSENRFVAARPDGAIVLQMKDVSGVVIGYVHRVTGEFVARQQVEALLSPEVS